MLTFMFELHLILLRVVSALLSSGISSSYDLRLFFPASPGGGPISAVTCSVPSFSFSRKETSVHNRHIDVHEHDIVGGRLAAHNLDSLFGTPDLSSFY